MLAQAQIESYMHDLRQQVRGDVRTDDYSRMFYSTDASIYRQQPYGVLLPRSAEDTHAAIELATQYNMPILPRAGGTSLAGQCTNAALVIDSSKHLNGVLELNVEEKWVIVQSGMVLDELNLYLRPYGLKFGPDPASSSRAALGGIVSNNSTGSHSILYGMTADHVLEMDVILSDGSWTTFGATSTRDLLQYQTRNDFEAKIYQKFAALTFNERNREIIASGTPRHWRRCGGYNLDRFVNGEGVNFRLPQDTTFNLAKLVCGAEGTLAVINSVKLNLVDLPKQSAIAVVHFDELKASLDAVPHMLELFPSAIELVDYIGLTRARQVPEYARLLKTFIEGEPNCILITEFYGENERELRQKIDALEVHMQQRGIGYSGLTRAFSAEKQSNIWHVRKVGLGFLMSVKGDHKPIPFIEDAAVPPQFLADYILRLEKFCNSIGTEVAYYAHASAGCLHVRPLIDTKVATDIDKMPAIITFALDLLGEYGGALSSEHGDGLARSWANEAFFGAKLYKLYQDTKQIFDPHNLLNPGNLVNAPDMRENLRYGTEYKVIDISEHLDFSADMGFHRAVEMCNGAGVCRKTTAGTMCPPFMVTREEEHSTRGRANALRAAMSGALPASELTSPRMREVMELCVSCKACKAECPSSVDMAKIKAEWQAHFLAENGTPIRSRIFANIGTLSKIGSQVAPLANFTLSNPVAKWGLDKFVGISVERELPHFARHSFWDWWQQHEQSAGRLSRRVAQRNVPNRGRVVLLTDTYNVYNYPEITIAAVEVLERLGFEVIPTRQTCVGRPAMSKGLLKQAAKFARQTLNELAPYAIAGLPIIGLEPSDVSMITDDYAFLLPDDARVAFVHAQTLLFDQFIAGLAADVTRGVFSKSGGRVLLHGHCHQKALIGIQPTQQILRDLLGLAVEEVDSGCCGMAGSFGYEAEHVAMSLKMGERRLLPAVRAQDKDTFIVAAGVSCREQIKHGANRRALHLAELLRAFAHA